MYCKLTTLACERLAWTSLGSAVVYTRFSMWRWISSIHNKMKTRHSWTDLSLWCSILGAFLSLFFFFRGRCTAVASVNGTT